MNAAEKQSQELESESRLKAAQPENEAMVSFKLRDVRDWVEWLRAHEGQLLRIFTMVEELTEAANSGSRLFNEKYSPDNVHDRYDEHEEHRNEALRLIRWIGQTERTLAEALDEVVHAHWIANRDKTQQGGTIPPIDKGAP